MSMPSRNDAQILVALEAIALDAGRAACELFKAGCSVKQKADKSPVTEADEAAEAIILEGLSRALPGIPVLAEEAVHAGTMPNDLGDEFLLVDPLDGTREFVGGSGDFTVNIALVRGGVPIIGVVYAPVRGLLFAGRPGHAERARVDEAYAITERVPVHVRDATARPDVVASHSHRDADTDRFIAGLSVGSVVAVGSSLKFCMLAAGEADIYPRCGPTMQWDTAAGDAVLRAAGGVTATMDGAPLTYGYHEGEGAGRLANPWFIARGGLAAKD